MTTTVETLLAHTWHQVGCKCGWVNPTSYDDGEPEEADRAHAEHVAEQLGPKPKVRPWGTVWGLLNAKGAPWTRPLNDDELRAKDLDPAEYEPETHGRWSW